MFLLIVYFIFWNNLIFTLNSRYLSLCYFDYLHLYLSNLTHHGFLLMTSSSLSPINAFLRERN